MNQSTRTEASQAHPAMPWPLLEVQLDVWLGKGESAAGPLWRSLQAVPITAPGSLAVIVMATGLPESGSLG